MLKVTQPENGPKSLVLIPSALPSNVPRCPGMEQHFLQLVPAGWSVPFDRGPHGTGRQVKHQPCECDCPAGVVSSTVYERRA